MSCKELRFRYQVPLPVAGVSGQSRFECLLCVLGIWLDTQEICFLRRRADDLEKRERERHFRPVAILPMPSFFSGIDFQERTAMERVHLPKLGFLDEMLDAHPLDEHFSFSLVLFLEDAFRRGFFENSFLRNVPAAPVIEFVVVVYDRRPVGAMRSPSAAALTFRPHVSDKEDESVDEAEFRSEGEVGLKTLSRALRDVAKPPRKRLPANFPRKLREQLFTDGPGAIV